MEKGFLSKETAQHADHVWNQLPWMISGGGGGTGGRETGRKGAGGVREAGEEGAESGRKREKLRNIAQYFAIEKLRRGGSQKIQGGNRD